MEDSMPNFQDGEVLDTAFFEPTVDLPTRFVYPSVESLIYPSTGDDEVDIQTSIAKARVDGYEVAQDREDNFVKQTLNAFLDHLPNQAKLVLCEETMRCATNDQLYTMYSRLRDRVLLPMLTRNPDDRAKLHDQKQRQLHEQCLDRDGDACVVTRIMDTVRYHAQSQPDERVEGLTNAIYILSRSYEEDHESTDDDSGTLSVGSAWEALRSYLPSTAGALDPYAVRSASNMLTLWDELAKEWDTFGVSLEPTAVSNHYIFRIWPHCEGDFSELADTTVGLQQSDSGQGIALPHVELIRGHHTIAAILAQPGITEYLQSTLFKLKN